MAEGPRSTSHYEHVEVKYAWRSCTHLCRRSQKTYAVRLRVSRLAKRWPIILAHL